MEKEYQQAKEILLNGGIGVIPTDTIYGIVARAEDEEAVERVYRVKKRPKTENMIVLVGKLEDVVGLGLIMSEKVEKFLKRSWPGPISFILPASEKTPAHLPRHNNTLAIRMPKKDKLLSLLREVGPVVAPSANIFGEEWAQTINEAKEVFGDKLDFYVCEGRQVGEPSTLVGFDIQGEFKVFREGAVSKEEILKIWQS